MGLSHDTRVLGHVYWERKGEGKLHECVTLLLLVPYCGLIIRPTDIGAVWLASSRSRSPCRPRALLAVKP